jgi:alpha-L-fucosidase 2
MDETQWLWYKQPAACWEEALPLGNGRIGAMVYGGITRERVAMNEDTLWSGYNRHRAADTRCENRAAQARDGQNEAARDGQYRAAQALALSGQYREAQELIERTLLGPFTQSYLPLCELRLNFPDKGEVTGYRRSLSLPEALCRTVYTVGNVAYEREAFVSAPGQAMYLQLSADRPGQISFAMECACRLRHTVSSEGSALSLAGICPSDVVPSYIACDNPITYADRDDQKGMRFAARAWVEAEGGTVTCLDGSVHVQNADRVLVRFTARTSFNGYDRHPYLDGQDEAALCARDARDAGMPYEAARALHIRDHTALYGRVSLSLGPDVWANCPTNERLKAARPDDNGLCALLFHYGRYLLIACSRPGTQAANLQGLWNEHLRAIWSCNYTININTQMNYWPAAPCALGELSEPLLDLTAGLIATGRDTARAYYGARGAVSHHNTDIWRLSSPVGGGQEGFAGCAFFPLSLGWLCENLYEGWRYSGDKEYLRGSVLPALREAARFYLDIMVPDKNGCLIITPATSPENVFTYRGETVKVARESTINTAIVRETLNHYLAALDTLALDEPMKAEALAALPRLPGYRVGSRRQMLEWEEEYAEPEPDHRHVSHLYGLYPGHEITPEGTPALADACRRSLELRGGFGTGWSLGWKINLWARLGNGENARQALLRQLQPVEPGAGMNLNSGGTYPNLLDSHPPFQIDGNFGACAGIAEMLLQSGDGMIRLLPALPSAWREGSFSGLRAWGGVEVDVWFTDGALARAVIRRPRGGNLTVKYKDRALVLPEGTATVVISSGFQLA